VFLRAHLETSTTRKPATTMAVEALKKRCLQPNIKFGNLGYIGIHVHRETTK
jgi:hypothetical protein